MIRRERGCPEFGKSTRTPYDFKGRFLTQVSWNFLQGGILEIPSVKEVMEGSLGQSLNRGLANWKALARANGTSREIDCEAIGG